MYASIHMLLGREFHEFYECVSASERLHSFVQRSKSAASLQLEIETEAHLTWPGSSGLRTRRFILLSIVAAP